MHFLESAHTFRRKDGTTSQKLFDTEEMKSEGTLKILDLSGPIIDTLANGYTLVIDELDAQLHPLLTQRIIQIFNSQKSTPHNAQLIFATHDTNLLRNKILRRDQIWFVEKDKTDEFSRLKVSATLKSMTRTTTARSAGTAFSKRTTLTTSMGPCRMSARIST